MAVVALKIGGRFYKFSCADGQEIHMKELASVLDEKAEQLTKALGVMQEGQLLAMICLLLAEEMNQLKVNGGGLSEDVEEQIASTLTNLATKVSGLAEQLGA